MDYNTANKIMAEIHLRRDWTVIWHRISPTTMFVQIKGIVDNSSDYPNYTRKSIAVTEFYVDLAALSAPMDLINLVMEKLLVAATHEEREFFRFGPNWVAPFHPHTPLGTRNWSQLAAAKKNLVLA